MNQGEGQRPTVVLDVSNGYTLVCTSDGREHFLKSGEYEPLTTKRLEARRAGVRGGPRPLAGDYEADGLFGQDVTLDLDEIVSVTRHTGVSFNLERHFMTYLYGQSSEGEGKPPWQQGGD